MLPLVLVVRQRCGFASVAFDDAAVTDLCDPTDEGFPVVETGDKSHVNVHQKVPLNRDRDGRGRCAQRLGHRDPRQLTGTGGDFIVKRPLHDVPDKQVFFTHRAAASTLCAELGLIESNSHLVRDRALFASHYRNRIEEPLRRPRRVDQEMHPVPF